MVCDLYKSMRLVISDYLKEQLTVSSSIINNTKYKTMKTKLKIISASLIVGALAFTSAKAQTVGTNLVLNGDFEHVENEPNAYGEAEEAIAWSDPSYGSADLFSQEARDNDVSVPENDLGQQIAFSGDNYAGIIAHYEDGVFDLASFLAGGDTEKIGYGKYREYVQAELIKPLQAGQMYQVTFKVNLAEESDRAISGLGAYFTQEHMEIEDNTFIPVTPQVSSNKIIDSKNQWQTISGVFTAEGGEHHVIIGAFEDKFAVADLSDPMDNDSRKAYYYIDAVEVAPYTPPVVETPDVHVVVIDFDPLLSGEAVVLDRVFFDIGESDMSDNAEEDLDELAAWLKGHPENDLVITGHTDEQGTDEVNNKLSRERAKEIKDYLIKKGVSANRLRAIGYGDDRPWDEEPLHDNPLNRRTEIKMILK